MIILKYSVILTLVVVSGLNSLVHIGDEAKRDWVPEKYGYSYNTGRYRNETRKYWMSGYYVKSTTHCTLTNDSVGNITVEIGYSRQSSSYCGTYSCVENDDKTAGAMYLYCAMPVTFAECDNDGVNTRVDYPECCWQCVAFKKCD